MELHFRLNSRLFIMSRSIQFCWEHPHVSPHKHASVNHIITDVGRMHPSSAHHNLLSLHIYNLLCSSGVWRFFMKS